MIVGHVTAELEARLPEPVLRAHGECLPVEAVMDTGYDGYLTLPTAFIHELGLTYHSLATAELGDGNEVVLARYEGRVRWHDEEREVLVLAAEGGPLLGMALLRGKRVAIDVVPDGVVTITHL